MKRLERLKLALKNGFTYDSVTGNVITPTGKICSKKTKNGYLMLTIRDEERKMYYVLAHQFGWFYIYNEIVDCIDHINRNKTDNRIENLRSVTKSQNAMNMNNVKGYSYSKRNNKYESYIMLNGKKKHLGAFETEQEASKCYLENKNKIHIIN